MDLLKDPPSSFAISLQAGNTVKNAYHQIADILNQIKKPEQIPPPTSIQHDAATARVKILKRSLSTLPAVALRVQQESTTISLAEKINVAIEQLKEKYQPNLPYLPIQPTKPKAYTDFKIWQ